MARFPRAPGGIEIDQKRGNAQGGIRVQVELVPQE